MKKEGLALSLAICVLGLYSTFLTWSVLQERINTTPYGDNEYFRAPLIINIVQAFLASIVGLFYTAVTSKSSPFDVFTQNGKQGWQVFKSLVLISICSSVASPIGYKSLAHLDYLAYLLAKSCKLIPVMLVHFILYKTRFPMFKYIVALLVTLGVTIFTLAHSKESRKVNDGNTALGLAYLIGSMLLDGLTNSTQDQLFKILLKRKFTGANLMCVLNLFIFVLTTAYLVLFQNQRLAKLINSFNDTLNCCMILLYLPAVVLLDKCLYSSSWNILTQLC